MPCNVMPNLMDVGYTVTTIMRFEHTTNVHLLFAYSICAKWIRRSISSCRLSAFEYDAEILSVVWHTHVRSD